MKRSPFAGELAQPLRMHTLGAGRIKADGAQQGQLLDNAVEGFVAWGAGWLPCPGQRAYGGPLLGVEQIVQCLGLGRGQGGGELPRHMAFRHDQGGGDQALDDARAGGDDPAPAQLVHQRRGDRHSVGGGQRHRQQPGEHVAALSGSEHPEAERFAQPVELLAPGLGPGCIGSKRIGADAKLAGDELQGCLRNDLAWPKQPSRVAEGAKLQGIAELVVPTTAALDHGQVGCTQSPVADQVGFRCRKGKQGFELRFGERVASWHGGCPN